MPKATAFIAASLLSLLWIGGCNRFTPEISAEKVAAENPVVWLEESLAVGDLTISLGCRDRKPKAGDWLEPIVAITKNGKTVADAMVFDQLVSLDDQTTLSDEVATVFEPASDGKPAYYAQGKLRLPEQGTDVAVRFRIILPGIAEEWMRDVTLQPVADSAISK